MFKPKSNDRGCGKSTQVPQYLHEAGWSKGQRVIGCTQPTRVATIALARRVASERGSRLGEEVGFAALFGQNYDLNKTRIKYMTDDHLIREMMVDPLLSKYSCLVIDEAHERNVKPCVRPSADKRPRRLPLRLSALL